MDSLELAKSIARDCTCAQGEFHARVNSIIPYLTEIDEMRAEVERLTRERNEALQACLEQRHRAQEAEGSEMVAKMQRDEALAEADLLKHRIDEASRLINDDAGIMALRALEGEYDDTIEQQTRIGNGTSGQCAPETKKPPTP